MKNKTTMIRSDKGLKKMLDEIRWKRFKDGVDKKPLPNSRLTKALTRIPKLKEILSTANIKND